MAKISDYLGPETLRELRERFSDVAQAPVLIGWADEEAGSAESPPSADACPATEAGGAKDVLSLCAEVRMDGEPVGWVSLADSPDSVEWRSGEKKAWMSRFVRLLADVVARLCRREELLRTRVEELATLYKLTAEFTGRRDLQETLDIVARTVVEVLKAKACAIRLLNEDHTELVIKAVANLSPEYLDKGPILLTESRIDREVLATGKPMHIADLRNDPRVLYPREARREGIVSGLCAPMVYKGRPEGVLRVYTDRVHEFGWFEESLLKAVAAEAAAAIVNARLYAEAVHSANMRRQLALAGEVQRRMIPDAPPAVAGVDIGAVYVPSHELSGDFYDFIRLPGDNLGIAICDVVGKGVRSSLLMASVRASLRAHAVNVYDMRDVLYRVNRDLCADTLISDFATMFYAVLDARKRRLTYASAGHIPPLLVRDGHVRTLGTGGMMLGIDPDGHWEHESLLLEAGDVILAHTDGLSEALNFEDESFGRNRVERALLGAVELGRNAEATARHVLWEMRRFAGLQKRFDDLTMVVLKILESP